MPITATHLKELLTELDLLGVHTPEGCTVNLALVDDQGRLRATATLRELRALARAGCPAHPDAACDCPLLGMPPAVDRYRPTPAQRRFLTTRDRTCRHPGCRQQGRLGRPRPRPRPRPRRGHRLHATCAACADDTTG